MKSKLILTAAVLSAMAGGGAFLTLRKYKFLVILHCPIQSLLRMHILAQERTHRLQ